MLVFLEIARDNKHIYNIIWESLYIDKNKFIVYYNGIWKFCRDNYSQKLQESADKGEIRSDIDPEVLAWALMGLSNFLGLRYVIFKEEENLDIIVDKAMKFIEKGLF